MAVFRRLLAIFCVLMLLCALASPVCATESRANQALLQQMLNYFYHYQTQGKADIYRLLDQMRENDPGKADCWQRIFEYWFFATDEMPKNETVLPDGLAQDESLCIVVLGFRLYEEGGIRPELKGRLRLALEAAQKYPNAYILCCGGGTASQAPKVKEAKQMRDWLVDQGISRSRIITESNSLYTYENAEFGIEILTEQYPQIRQLAIVTSDYHLTRSSTLFFAQAVHTAYEKDLEPLEFVAWLGYEAGHEGGADTTLDQTAHLARLSGFEFERGDRPPLSKLTNLTISGETLLEPGQMPEIRVMAHYDTGFSRDVTSQCAISGFDPEFPRTQFLTATYAESGLQIQASLEIRRPVVETQPPATEAPEPVPAAEPITTMPLAEPAFPLWPLGTGLAVVALAVFLLRKRK